MGQVDTACCMFYGQKGQGYQLDWWGGANPIILQALVSQKNLAQMATTLDLPTTDAFLELFNMHTNRSEGRSGSWFRVPGPSAAPSGHLAFLKRKKWSSGGKKPYGFVVFLVVFSGFYWFYKNF